MVRWFVGVAVDHLEARSGDQRLQRTPCEVKNVGQMEVADVIVETHRVTAGIDWQPTCDMNVYLRYIFFDYGDISANLTSGTAHMVLAGGTRTW